MKTFKSLLSLLTIINFLLFVTNATFMGNTVTVMKKFNFSNFKTQVNLGVTMVMPHKNINVDQHSTKFDLFDHDKKRTFNALNFLEVMQHYKYKFGSQSTLLQFPITESSDQPSGLLLKVPKYFTLTNIIIKENNDNVKFYEMKILIKSCSTHKIHYKLFKPNYWIKYPDKSENIMLDWNRIGIPLSKEDQNFNMVELMTKQDGKKLKENIQLFNIEYKDDDMTNEE